MTIDQKPISLNVQEPKNRIALVFETRQGSSGLELGELKEGYLVGVKDGKVQLVPVEVDTADLEGCYANAMLYTDTKIAEIVNSAPDTLNTLNELSAALADDPNFATTMTNALAAKADSATVDNQMTAKANVSDLTTHTGNAGIHQTHANKSAIDKVIDSGDGSKYLNDKGEYAAISAPSTTKIFNTVHTWAIGAEVTTTMTISPFFFSKAAGQTSRIVKVIYKIASGTSVTAAISQNGSGIVNAMNVTTTKVSSPQNITLADEDLLSLSVSAVSGTPKGMTVTVVIEHTV
jgi:hypothetical protein